ncbi:MAG: hypothetical protein ACI9R3_000623 [Verrucomicrobiales bacterium]|jgi:hypothetical protein
MGVGPVLLGESLLWSFFDPGTFEGGFARGTRDPGDKGWEFEVLVIEGAEDPVRGASHTMTDVRVPYVGPGSTFVFYGAAKQFGMVEEPTIYANFGGVWRIIVDKEMMAGEGVAVLFAIEENSWDGRTLVFRAFFQDGSHGLYTVGSAPGWMNYDEWVVPLFPTGPEPNAKFREFADPDGDGKSNFVEFGTGTNGSVADREEPLLIEDASLAELSFTRRMSIAGGYEVVPQVLVDGIWMEGDGVLEQLSVDELGDGVRDQVRIRVRPAVLAGEDRVALVRLQVREVF